MVLALLNKPTTPGTASHLLTSTLTCCIVHLSRSTLWQWMCYSSVYTLTDLLQFLVWLFRDWETPMCQEPPQAAFVCQPLCETKSKLSDSFILCTTPRVIGTLRPLQELCVVTLQSWHVGNWDTAHFICSDQALSLYICILTSCSLLWILLVLQNVSMQIKMNGTIYANTY